MIYIIENSCSNIRTYFVVFSKNNNIFRIKYLLNQFPDAKIIVVIRNPIDLAFSSAKVHFKFLTGKDEQEITVMTERKKKQGVKVDNLVTTRLQYSLVAIDGIKDRNKLSTFIRNMPARDSLTLRKYIDELEPGLDMKTWMDCPHCDTSSEVRLPMGASFFWPDSE